MKKILLIVGAAALALIAITGVAWGAGHVLGGKKTDTHAIAGPVRSVVVDVDAGDVALVPGDRAEVRETRHWGLFKPRVSRGVRDGVLTVKAECPGGWLADCRTDLRVSVPAEARVRVATHVGDITGHALVTRDADAETDVGDLDLAWAQAPTRLRMKANVGDLTLAVPSGTYAVDADTNIGDRDVRDVVEDGRASRRLHLVTDVGDVDVRGR